MAWWREARFGMFIHWGLYAIPAGEWNGETNHAEWIRTTEITYRNGLFQSGYADRGHLLGHPLGPDAMGFYLFARYLYDDPLWFQTRFGFERRGRNEKNQGGGDIRGIIPTFEAPENRFQFSVRPTWQATPGPACGRPFL